MKPVALCVCALVMLACEKEPFRWRTDSGLECDARCDAGACSGDAMLCSPPSAPGFNCSDFNRNELVFVPCWNAGPVSVWSLQPDPDSGGWGVCQACCCENCNGGAGWAQPHCELLTCAQTAEAPPLPLECVQGRVVVSGRSR